MALRRRPIRPWLISLNRNSLRSQPYSSCITRSPRRVLSRICRLCSMSSAPDTVCTSLPAEAKLGGKLQPVPRKESSSCMSVLVLCVDGWARFVPLSLHVDLLAFDLHAVLRGQLEIFRA